MKTLTIIFLIFLSFSIEINAQWYLQYQSPTFAGIYDVRFLNRDTGWSCGEGMILKTTNGGENWMVQNMPYTFMQIHPVNDSVIYACGFYVILKTTNSGNNWFTLWQGTSNDAIFYGLWFNDENRGWFCGDRVAMRTTNGGNTFIDSQFVATELHDVHFKNDSVGIIAAYARIFRTTNAGTNWYPILLPSTLATPFLERVSFVEDTGWTISWGGVVFRTTNYGVIWDSLTDIPFGSGLRAYSIDFPNELIGYAGGSHGRIFKTTDGGYNWNLSHNYENGAFRSIFSFNDSIVWAVGAGIQNTTNGGGFLVNSQNASIVFEKEFELFQNYPNPFNNTTIIKFKIIFDAFTRLKVFDLSGKEVADLINRRLKTGEHKIIFDGSNLSSGVYLYTMESYNEKSKKVYMETKKFLLIK